jgi:hypothetical protein
VTRYVLRHGKRIAVETLDVDAALKKKGLRTSAKPKRQYVQLPWTWINYLNNARLPAACWYIAAHLVYEWWRTDGKPIVLANGVLARVGINRWTKNRALRELEQAALIDVEWRRRKSPIVTWALDPRQGR